MRGFGADPGSSRTGAARVLLDPVGWFHIEWGGHIENESAELDRQLAACAQDCIPVFMEQIVGQVYKGRSATQLFETKSAEGALRMMAKNRGCQFETIAGRDWRNALCLSPTASDEQVRIVIEGICRTIPKLRHDARPHVYDAAGAAIVGMIRLSGRRFVLPMQVASALCMQQALEKQRRAEKKALGKVDEPMMRALSRVQRERKSKAAKEAWKRRKLG